MSRLLAACGGFLSAVVWMDLIFDVQVQRHARPAGALPESVLASIAGYYRRATTDSRPMSRLIAATMLVAVVGSAVQLVRGDGSLAARALALVLCGAPTLLAGGRVVPNAVRLGQRSDDADVQSALARGICRDHWLCFASIVAFTALQISGI
ncbi:MAG: hypothetical protein ACRDMZ_00235 [Solirubrobacteraceae bacterium]